MEIEPIQENGDSGPFGIFNRTTIDPFKFKGFNNKKKKVLLK